MSHKSPGCQGKCEQGRTRCPSPEVCFRPREARDSLLDTVIPDLPWHDSGALDIEKRPLLSPRGSLIFVGSAVAIFLVALAFALA